MSIRLKMIIAYFCIVFISVIMLIGGMVRATTDFMQNLSESTIGDHSFEQVVEAFINVMVDVEYISRYDQSLIDDEDYLRGIEAQIEEFEIGMYIEQDGALTYVSALDDRIQFDLHYRHIEFEDEWEGNSKHKGSNEAFAGTSYNTGDAKFVILRHAIAENLTDNGNIYLVAPQRDMASVGEAVFAGFFRGILGVMLVVVITMAVMITYWIVKPLRTLEESAEKIAQGQLDFSIRTSRRDEIGQVMNSFETMREELHKSIEQQLQYEENRKELIASISHDLKTPITSIKGYVEGIRDGVATDKDKLDEYLDVIYYKSIDLDQLIDDLFLFSKLDLNRVPFNFVEMDAVSFFDDSYHEIQMDLEKAGFRLDYTQSLEGPVPISIDPQQIKRVMMNIVSNAVKYSRDRHEVVMSVSQGNDRVHLSIKDYGKGISKEDLIQIFDKFYRCDPARNTDINGSGLGLAIAKQIVDRHNGSIWAESELGAGTTIHISLPVYVKTEEAIDAESGEI